jgi:ketosteroid isomerase-like protein
VRLLTVRMLALVTIIGLSACATQAPTQEFGKEDATRLKQLIEQFVAAYNAKDVAKMGTLYSANSAILPPNRSTLRGVDLVKSYFEGRWKDDGATNLTVEPLTVDGHGPLGFITGTFELDLKGPDGSGTGRDRGKVMWIVRKYADQWKFEWQMMSSDLPPSVPQIAPETKSGTAPVKK